jgi:hypothetical protein
VAKRYVLPVLVLLAIVAAMEWTPSVIGSHTDIERASERIGWTTAIESDHLARDVFERVNDERVERGLPPLGWHDGLANVARAWSEEMIATGYRHSSDEFRALSEFAGTGENIFMGPRSTAELHVGWMESDGHRDNVLHPGYSAIGIGVVCRNDGTMWATQIFGLAHGVATPPPAPTARGPVTRTDGGRRCDGSDETVGWEGWDWSR